MSFVPLERLAVAPARMQARRSAAGPRLLERFDRPDTPTQTDRADAIGEAEAPPAPSLEAPEAVPEAPPEQDTACGADEAAIAFDAARGDLLARLAGLVARAEAEWAAASRAREAAFAEGLAAAAAAAVPHLAATAFPAEVESVARAAVAALPDRRLEVRLAPDDLTALAPFVDEATPLPLAADSALVPGAVRLSWGEGGLDLDRDRLTAAALERLADHLPSLEPGDRDP